MHNNFNWDLRVFLNGVWWVLNKVQIDSKQMEVNVRVWAASSVHRGSEVSPSSAENRSRTCWAVCVGGRRSYTPPAGLRCAGAPGRRPPSPASRGPSERWCRRPERRNHLPVTKPPRLYLLNRKTSRLCGVQVHTHMWCLLLLHGRKEMWHTGNRKLIRLPAAPPAGQNNNNNNTTTDCC